MIVPTARIAIITSGPLCRHPRVLKEATTLGRAGYDVNVLTIAHTARFEEFDREILRAAPFRKIVVDQTASDPATRLRRILSRGRIWAGRRLTRWGIESGYALGFVHDLAKLAHRHPADLTIVHTEAPFLVGLGLLNRGRKVAADFEDWHTRDLLPNAQSTRPRQLLARLEGELMRRTAYTSTTSHAMAAALQAAYGGNRPAILTNSFPLTEATRSRSNGEVPAFFWFSQTVGTGRGLEEFVAAWSLTRQPSRLILLGDVSDDYRHLLLGSLPADRRKRLEFQPLVSPADLPALIARHQIGLALEPTTPANKNLTISNKILQYLNAGIAVLATGTAGQREVLERSPGAGQIIDLANPTALAAQLDSLLADRAQMNAMGASARRAAEAIYCWEKEEPTLLAAVARALATA